MSVTLIQWFSKRKDKINKNEEEEMCSLIENSTSFKVYFLKAFSELRFTYLFF